MCVCVTVSLSVCVCEYLACLFLCWCSVGPAFFNVALHSSHVILTPQLTLPQRIRERWYKSHTGFRFNVAKALPIANTSAKEFRKSWKMVKPIIPGKELFRMFEKGFGVRDDHDSKAAFIKDIVRRYKAMGEVSYRVVCFFCVCVLRRPTLFCFYALCNCPSIASNAGSTE